MELAKFIELANSNTSNEAYEMLQSDKEEILALFKTANDVCLLIEKAGRTLTAYALINDHSKYIVNLFKTPEDLFQLIMIHHDYANILMSNSRSYVRRLFQQSDDIIRLALLSSSCAITIIALERFDEFKKIFKDTRINNLIFQLAKKEIHCNLTSLITKFIPIENIENDQFNLLLEIMKTNPTINACEIDELKHFFARTNNRYPGFFSSLITAIDNTVHEIRCITFGSKV